MALFNDELLQAFGLVSVNFSQLEEMLLCYTAKLISPRDTNIGYATLADLSFENMMRIFRSLVIERTSLRFSMLSRPLQRNGTEVREKMKALLKKIDGVRARRNDIIHSHWSPSYFQDAESDDYIQSPDEVQLTRHRKNDKEGYTFKTTTRTLLELQLLAEAIDDAFRDLLGFVVWTNSVLPSSAALFPPDLDFSEP
jgi:hypothetical protein